MTLAKSRSYHVLSCDVLGGGEVGQFCACDDDFLSHLLVEKLGTDNVPLLVQKMDPSR